MVSGHSFKEYVSPYIPDLINALTGDWSSWPQIKVENVFPHSTFWDFVLFGVSLLDMFGPFFRLLNNAV